MQISAQNALVLWLFVAATALPLAFAQTSTPTAPPPPFPHVSYPTGTATPLGQQVAALLSDPSVSRAHWGIAVTALDGTPIYGYDEGRLFRPASNNKIFTTATAIALLGPGKTFTTRIFGAFDPATGTVTGPLTLVGAGDANFAADDLPYIPRSERPTPPQPPPPQPPALSDLASLADQLVAKGLKRITGGVIGDDTLYPYEPYAESWAADDQVWGYGAPISALSIDNNQLKLVITPGAALDPQHFAPATVQLEQNVPYYIVESQVTTLPPGSPSTGVQVERLPGSLLVRVYGAIAADATPDVEELAIADPAQYAAMVLRSMLVQRGVIIEGTATSHHRPVDNRSYLATLLTPNACDAALVASAPSTSASPSINPAPSGDLLASHTSAPLAEDIVLTNKISQNLHAELDLHNLGVLAPCGAGSALAGSTLAGASLIRANLLHAGLDPDDFLFFDGSGLSAHDLVAPRATAAFLAYAAQQPWFAQWKASLPDAGEGGPLSRRFPDPPVKDHIFAKTGTLGESRALSGYLDAASGRTVIFSILVDDHTPATVADRITMDKIVTAIAATQ
jgi:D-alanyl-D-alanine carboxypeptidase/D-alanyl-D-alanine-endopeptidase (penicillin-binding protein 4)